MQMEIEKITSIIPEAEISQTGEAVVKVPAEKLHQIAETLLNDKENPMDFLRDIVGMDWGEEGLGALYLLESTRTGARITLKAVTTDREKALLPTVSDLWKTALIKEREVYDFFGICFLNHPDMRRIFLREDWIGYPMRKDYDMNSNPLRMDNEENADMTDEYFLRPDGTLEGRKNVVFGEDDFVVNIGPQHPSTHGVLRMRTSLDGENIRKIDPILGYIHRGIEKMNESLTYPQTLALTDRLDYLSAHQNRHALCMCIEKAEYLNTCDNYVDKEKKNELLDVNNLENNKMIEWSHLSTLMTLENLNNEKEINQNLLDEIGENFNYTVLYESIILNLNGEKSKNKVKERIKEDNIKIKYLIGNNGKISDVELKQMVKNNIGILDKKQKVV